MSSRLSNYKIKKQSSVRYCGHCNEYISRAAFWKHRKFFYNQQTMTWKTKKNMQASKHTSEKLVSQISMDDQSFFGSSEEEEEIDQVIDGNQVVLIRIMYITVILQALRINLLSSPMLLQKAKRHIRPSTALKKKSKYLIVIWYVF